MIYFIRAEGIGHVKIGFTDKDPIIRLAELQVGSPVKLTMIGTLPGNLGTEHDLHRRFAFARVHGEWFRPCAELLGLLPPTEAPLVGQPVPEIRHVEVKVLTINGKQVTQAFFRQLVVMEIIDWETFWNEDHHNPRTIDGRMFERGVPWGRCRHDTKEDDDYHLVWQQGRELRRCYVGRPFPESAARWLFDLPGPAAFRDENLDFIQQSADKSGWMGFWRKCRERWDVLDHLFIGV